jgi:hypothetical protein
VPATIGRVPWFRHNEKRFIEEVLLRLERSERRTAARYERIDRSLDDLHEKAQRQLRESRAEWETIRGSQIAILDRLDRWNPPPSEA